MKLLRKCFDAAGFLCYFVWELVAANFRLARDVLRPLSHLRPTIVAVPLNLTRDSQITVLANLVTLTPGTLSLDVSTDRKVLYVHAMHAPDPEALRQSVKEGFEKRILRLWL